MDVSACSSLPPCGGGSGRGGATSETSPVEPPPPTPPRKGEGRRNRRPLRRKGFRSASPSPSLPRRDDLDLVVGLERGLRPLAARQHVEIQRDRKMRALIFQFAEQRIDPR